MVLVLVPTAAKLHARRHRHLHVWPGAAHCTGIRQRSKHHCLLSTVTHTRTRSRTSLVVDAPSPQPAAAHVLLAKHHCHHRRHHCKPAPPTSAVVAGSPHANSLSSPPPLLGRDQGGDQACAERHVPGLRQNPATPAVAAPQGRCAGGAHHHQTHRAATQGKSARHCPRPVGQTETPPSPLQASRHDTTFTARQLPFRANSLSNSTRPPPLGRKRGDQGCAERRGPGLRQQHHATAVAAAPQGRCTGGAYDHQAHRTAAQGKCVWF